MDHYTLRWPVEFEEYSWEIESKGWFAGLEVVIDGKTLRPVFYDPVRLSQDVAAEVDKDGVFAEQCLIVVKKVTHELMENAIADLARSGALRKFV